MNTPFILHRRFFLAGAGTTLAALALGGCQTVQNYANDPMGAANTIGGLFASDGKAGPVDESALGQGLYPRLVAQSGGAYSNARVQSAVRSFSEPLFRVSKRQFRWEITVLDDNSPNAWALPGGKLGINKGMLRYAASESELAAVIAHEMGHAELSHQIAELESKGFTDRLVQFGKGVVQTEINAQVSGLNDLTSRGLDALTPAVSELITSGYSRGHEREADAYILTVFRATGYDPRQASAIFKTLDSLVPPGEDKTTSLFSTHPGTRDRIELIDEAAARLPAGGGSAGSADFATIKAVFPTRRYYLRNPAEAS